MGSPGKIFEYGLGAEMITAKLYNFDINKADLKTEHYNWPVSVVTPKLRNGGSISIVGLASRTGSDALNMKLSESRLRAVVNLLRQHVPNNFQVSIELAVGERAAMLSGMKDGVEHEGWRGVVISAWDKPTPPPPPAPPPVAESLAVDNKFLKRWLGFGGKAGGQLLFGGVESVGAYMVNLGDFETFNLEIVSSRWGLGLGGSGGALAVIGFGFSIPYELDHKELNDWGFNVAVAERFLSKSVIQAVQSTKYFVDGFKNGIYIAPKIQKAGKVAKHAKDAMNVRNLLHTLYGGLEAGKQKGGIVLDLPLLGKGLELSAFVTRGKMYASNASNWIEPQY